MMLERSFWSSACQSCSCQRFTAASRSRRSGSPAPRRTTSNAIPDVLSCSRSFGSSFARTTPSPAGSQAQPFAASIRPDSSAVRTRIATGPSIPASTSAILRLISSGSSVPRYTSRSVTHGRGDMRCSSM